MLLLYHIHWKNIYVKHLKKSHEEDFEYIHVKILVNFGGNLQNKLNSPVVCDTWNSFEFRSFLLSYIYMLEHKTGMISPCHNLHQIAWLISTLCVTTLSQLHLYPCFKSFISPHPSLFQLHNLIMLVKRYTEEISCEHNIMSREKKRCLHVLVRSPQRLTQYTNKLNAHHFFSHDTKYLQTCDFVVVEIITDKNQNLCILKDVWCKSLHGSECHRLAFLRVI